jgi:hypothetical protein
MATAVAESEQNLDILPERMECPLCLGQGNLSRTEVLQRLGMRDFTRIAQLSAEEAIRLLLQTEKQAEQGRWTKFEVELTKRLAEVSARHNAEVQKLQTEKNEINARLKAFENSASTTLQNAKDQQRLATEKELQSKCNSLTSRIAEMEATQSLMEQQKAAEIEKVRAQLEGALSTEKARASDLDRRVKHYLEEVNQVQARNQVLEAEMAKVARVGRKEELSFAEEVHTWPGIWISDKLPRHGDYLLAFRDPAGNAAEPKMLVDNKDKASISEPDVKKLIRDCQERKAPVGVLVAHDEGQLRQGDRECRWAQEDGIWLLRTTRAWLPRDLEVLRPVFERLRVEGPNYLQKNAALADEVRRTFVDLDEIEKELKKAGRAIDNAQSLASRYRSRLTGLCDDASSTKMPNQAAELQVEVASQ